MFQIFALPLKALKAIGLFMFEADPVELQRWRQRGEAERIKF